MGEETPTETPRRPRLRSVAHALKERARADSAPRRFVRRARWRRLQRRLAAPKLLRAFAARYPDAFFVEIGANDGDHHDHLRPFILDSGWSGIMVEPVPYVFDRLERNYGAIDRVTLANVAIADHDGELPFYHPAEALPEERDRLPHWYHGIGSFSRDNVLRHASAIPDIESRIRCRPVPVVTFDTLCERHGCGKVHLLLLDTEGYDWEILKSIDLEKHRPRLVIYEHYHLSAVERAESRRHLELFGYRTLQEGFDTLCLDVSEDDALTRRFGRLSPAVGAVSADEDRS